MAKKRVFVLGAGLAGLSAAWHLQRLGIACRIVEKEAEPGGLCRSRQVGGFTFDCDGHLLHFKHRYSFDFVRRLLGENLSEHKRSSWIYFCGRFRRYPFQANLYGLPSAIVKECLLGLVETSRGRPEGAAFEDWVYRKFGRGIARHFMIPYNRKFWTVPPRQLTCEWLEGVVPVPSLSQIIEGSVEESRRQFGYNARFWYPRNGGIQRLPQALAARVKGMQTGVAVTGIDLERKELSTSCGRERFDYLVSTIPMPELACIIKDLPGEVRRALKDLRWNSILNINLGLARKNGLKLHWAYFPQKELSFFRVGFFDNFSQTLAPPGKSSLYVEVSYSPQAPIDKSAIARRVTRDLCKVGLLESGDEIDVRDTNDIRYGYPIYDVRYTPSREKVLRYLAGKGMFPAGRYGFWRYFSMEDSILDGKRAAEFLYAHA